MNINCEEILIDEPEMKDISANSIMVRTRLLASNFNPA